jgi:hypothetical protein
VAVSATPNDQWNGTQVANFVAAEASVGTVSGPPLAARVVHGSQLPEWMPAGTVFEVGDCEGLYISNGENYATVPLERYQHATWMPADEGVPYRHELQLAFSLDPSTGSRTLRLLTSGASTISVVVDVGRVGGPVSATFAESDPTYPVVSAAVSVAPGSVHDVSLVTDYQLHEVTLTMDGVLYLDGAFTGGPGASVPQATGTGPSGSGPAPVAVTDVTDAAAESALCRGVTDRS